MTNLASLLLFYYRLISPKSILLSGTGHCKISRLHHACNCSGHNLTEDIGETEYKAPEISNRELMPNTVRV